MNRIEMRMKAVMQHRAECNDCSDAWPYGAGSRNAAKWHAKRLGHDVVVIVKTRALWGPIS